MRVYINSPAFHIRPANTDWQYTRLLQRLPDFVDGLEIYPQSALGNSVKYNLSYLLTSCSQRLRLPMPAKWLLGLKSTLSRRDLIHRSKADLVYSYGHFPTNASPVPVIFHTGSTDHTALLNRGVSEAGIEHERLLKRECARDAALVTVNSNAAAENLRAFMPEFASKIRMTPFFLPHLKAIDQPSVAKKFQDPETIKMTFVGRQARRKGLPAVLDAFTRLNSEFPGKLELTVVSNFADGIIELPAVHNVVWIKSAPPAEVRRILVDSHFLLMPSRYESYGWVYLEAMAVGAIPVACEAPIQNEILDNGRCGLLVTLDAASIVEKLGSLLKNPEKMQTLAHAAFDRCSQEYLPEVAANRMKELFDEALRTERS